jgi:site-specific DNA-methyltransferase (cytosine-N4-specific)
MQRSKTLRNYTKRLYGQLKDRTVKVITFFRDLDRCIEPILEGLNKGGIMVWILGNRRVGGKKVPLDRILSDLFNRYNVEVFCELTRKIPSKRMAIKNNIVKTMSDEIILLMRKVG